MSPRNAIGLILIGQSLWAAIIIFLGWGNNALAISGIAILPVGVYFFTRPEKERSNNGSDTRIKSTKT